MFSLCYLAHPKLTMTSVQNREANASKIFHLLPLCGAPSVKSPVSRALMYELFCISMATAPVISPKPLTDHQPPGGKTHIKCCAHCSAQGTVKYICGVNCTHKYLIALKSKQIVQTSVIGKTSAIDNLVCGWTFYLYHIVLCNKYILKK